MLIHNVPTRQFVKGTCRFNVHTPKKCFRLNFFEMCSLISKKKKRVPSVMQDCTWTRSTTFWADTPWWCRAQSPPLPASSGSRSGARGSPGCRRTATGAATTTSCPSRSAWTTTSRSSCSALCRGGRREVAALLLNERNFPEKNFKLWHFNAGASKVGVVCDGEGHVGEYLSLAERMWKNMTNLPTTK